jgi:hypothetical protein
MTETGQIKAVNKFKYLGSILEAIGATTLETEKIISEGRIMTVMLNSLVEQNYASQNQKTHVHVYFSTLNTQQTNKLLATEMDFWRRSARKSRKEKVRNVTIIERSWRWGRTF